MPYLFDTPEQRQKMFEAIGIQSIDDLFSQSPAELQLQRELELPAPVSELALQQEMEQRLGDGGTSNSTCFMGGGVYDHFIPAVVDEITSRGEFMRPTLLIRLKPVREHCRPFMNTRH